MVIEIVVVAVVLVIKMKMENLEKEQKKTHNERTNVRKKESSPQIGYLFFHLPTQPPFQ